jgi:hypothetical protein
MKRNRVPLQKGWVVWVRRLIFDLVIYKERFKERYGVEVVIV